MLRNNTGTHTPLFFYLIKDDGKIAEPFKIGKTIF